MLMAGAWKTEVYNHQAPQQEMAWSRSLPADDTASVHRVVPRAVSSQRRRRERADVAVRVHDSIM
jgi:hypothetical protein